MNRLKVLVLTSRELFGPEKKADAEFSYISGSRETNSYIELLTSCNIAFDIDYAESISFNKIISNGSLNYSTIVLALPQKKLPANTINLIKKLSHDHGVSIVAGYNQVNEGIKDIYGITRIAGKRLHFPPVMAMNKQWALDLDVENEIAMIDEWKPCLRGRGFSRYRITELKKYLLDYLERFFLLYEKVEVAADAGVIAEIKGKEDPGIIQHRYGKGTNYYVSVHPDYALKRFNSMNRVMRELIRKNSGWGMAGINLENTMILRMDDPGTCERVYLKGYDTKLMGRDTWRTIIELLKKHRARLSVMYIPLWVDDANNENGKLFVKGVEVKERQKGRMYSSKEIVFIKNHGKNEETTYDYSDEFNAIADGLRSGWLDIEAHGLTHVDTDIKRWLQADDRYVNPDWYHEFRHVYDNRDSSEEEQNQVLQKSAEKLEEFFGVAPSAVTPSGHEQSANSGLLAHEKGYKLFSTDYHSIVKGGMVIKCNKIRSIFLEETEPDGSYLKSGCPVVGVFHDFDIVKKGERWLEDMIDNWKQKGVSRFMTLRELAGYLCSSIETLQDGNRMNIRVDVSKTGGVSDKPESRFFSAHRMSIDITLPEDRRYAVIHVDGDPCSDFEYDEANRQIKLSLPPFRMKDKQEIAITLEPAPMIN